MVLEKILTADNVVVAINQNIDMLLEEVPELKYVINYKRRGREKLDLWSLTLLSLYNGSRKSVFSCVLLEQFELQLLQS